MARKRTSDKDLVVTSGTAAAPVRRKASATRPKHAPTAETPVASITEPEHEAPLAASSTGFEPSHDEISRLAYSYWLERGCQGGCPEEDWLRAEQELRAHSIAATV